MTTLLRQHAKAIVLGMIGLDICRGVYIFCCRMQFLLPAGLFSHPAHVNKSCSFSRPLRAKPLQASMRFVRAQFSPQGFKVLL